MRHLAAAARACIRVRGWNEAACELQKPFCKGSPLKPCTLHPGPCAQAAEPITSQTLFQIWNRVSLRTVQESYPVFNKNSLRACMRMSQASQYGLNSNTGPNVRPTPGQFGEVTCTRMHRPQQATAVPA